MLLHLTQTLEFYHIFPTKMSSTNHLATTITIITTTVVIILESLTNNKKPTKWTPSNRRPAWSCWAELSGADEVTCRIQCDHFVLGFFAENLLVELVFVEVYLGSWWTKLPGLFLNIQFIFDFFICGSFLPNISVELVWSFESLGWNIKECKQKYQTHIVRHMFFFFPIEWRAYPDGEHN